MLVRVARRATTRVLGRRIGVGARSFTKTLMVAVETGNGSLMTHGIQKPG